VDTIQFIQSSLYEVFRSFLAEITPLEPAEMLFRPTTEANSIAFLVWHYPRIADTVFHRSQGTSTVSEREKWYEAFGLAETDTGTGFGTEQVAAFQPNRKLLIGHLESVQKALDDGLSQMTSSDLDRPLNPENPRATVGRQIQSIIIGHGFFHLGEVRFLKGLQGMPFSR
jgi:hypothetical protein